MSEEWYSLSEDLVEAIVTCSDKKGLVQFSKLNKFCRSKAADCFLEIKKMLNRVEDLSYEDVLEFRFPHLWKNNLAWMKDIFPLQPLCAICYVNYWLKQNHRTFMFVVFSEKVEKINEADDFMVWQTTSFGILILDGHFYRWRFTNTDWNSEFAVEGMGTIEEVHDEYYLFSEGLDVFELCDPLVRYTSLEDGTQLDWQEWRAKFEPGTKASTEWHHAAVEHVDGRKLIMRSTGGGSINTCQLVEMFLDFKKKD